MDYLPLLPALVALILILITRQAAVSLFAAVVAASFLVVGPNPIAAMRLMFEKHLFPALQSDWNLSAILFTFILGAFATLLEKGGGFRAILDKLLNSRSRNPEKKFLFGIYGLGLLCFFDGLANALLLGRVGRPLADSLKVPRQFLAYLIDSTAAPVACVAFISTWIATQLSYINEGLEDAPFEVAPAELFAKSVMANPYCLLSLMIIPLIIFKVWLPGPMKSARPNEPELVDDPTGGASSPWRALVPLAALVISLPGLIYLWQDGEAWSWRNAFSSDGVPFAMVAAGFFALIVALACYPRERWKETGDHMIAGAASLFPALLILMMAWTLGSLFKQLETAELLTSFFEGKINAMQIPLAIFLLGAVMSFLTGTSWGTMGLLMPLALPLTLKLGADLPVDELQSLASMTIGAVFGGAVFGDHCSPFSDTTIVSALAAGCTPTSHIATQLPYALLVAGSAAIAYGLMSIGVASWIATLSLAAVLAALILTRKSGRFAER